MIPVNPVRSVNCEICGQEFVVLELNYRMELERLCFVCSEASDLEDEKELNFDND